MKQRQTLQLTTTLQAVKGSHDHPTVEQVHERVKERIRNVSLATVYRNLEKLRSNGEVQLVRLEGRGARWDGMTCPHDHFVCEGCGAIIDLDLGAPAEAANGLSAEGFVVRTHATAYYGACPACSPASNPAFLVGRD